MPTKKTTKKASVSKKSGNSTFDLQKMVQNTESYKGLVYGIVTVVVLFIVIALGVRTLSQNKAEIDNQAAMTTESEDLLTSNYIVSEGETLWSIAEKSYNDGYAWTEIAKANNLTNADTLEKGQKLVIPKRATKVTPVESASPTAAVMPTKAVVTTEVASPMPTKTEAVPLNEKITGATYKVVPGDNLWSIAVRAYGDGYRWVEISRMNNLTNPDLVFSGNTFKLPRP